MRISDWSSDVCSSDLWIHESAPGEYEVYVTDSFMEGEQYDVVPPLDQLDRRVRRYRVTFADPMHFLVRDEGSFGDTSEAAALRIVDSIAGDPDRQRLLVARSEERRRGKEGVMTGSSRGRPHK